MRVTNMLKFEMMREKLVHRIDRDTSGILVMAEMIPQLRLCKMFKRT